MLGGLGHEVLAVVRGSAVNQDGSKQWLDGSQRPLSAESYSSGAC